MKIFVFWQGLDPRATTNLFMDALFFGEKITNDEDCFILKIDIGAAICEAQSGPNYGIIHHTIWGYFSQHLGLLIQYEDSRLCLEWKLELKRMCSVKPALNQSWRWFSDCAREGGRQVSACRLEMDMWRRRPLSPVEGGGVAGG